MGGGLVRKTIGLAIFLLSVIIPLATALPPLPTEYYGTVTYYNEPAASGMLVEAYDSQENKCGEFNVRNAGYFGLLSCQGDDELTTMIEGPVEGETTNFIIDGLEASVFGNNTWDAGTFKYVDLVVPKVVCGDGFCDSRESCAACPEDCGPCETAETNVTGNETGEGTGGGDSTSGGDTDGGGASDGGAGGAISQIPAWLQPGDIFGFEGTGSFIPCQENWACGNWSECPPTEVQTRNCTDLNNCGTFKNKPAEKRACVYQEEVPEDNETGPEQERPPRQERPMQITFPDITCEKETNPIKNGWIWIFLAAAIAIIMRFVWEHKQIDRIRENQEFDKVKKAKLIYSKKRKTFIFVGATIFITIAAYLAYILFFQCTPNFTAIGLLALFLVLLPMIIHKIIDALEYHEEEKIVNLEKLHDTHYQHIKKLIELQNKSISHLEADIAKKLDFLATKESFMNLLDEYPDLEEIYKDMLKLYDEYQRQKVKASDEKELVDEIYKLVNNPNFNSLKAKDPHIAVLYNNLVMLYKHYEEKQELHDKLKQTEKNFWKELKEGEDMKEGGGEEKNGGGSQKEENDSSDELPEEQEEKNI